MSGAHGQVLILGAGGFLGLNLVEELLATGVVPHCGRRRRSNVLGLRARRVPLVPADLDDGAELAAAMQGKAVVYHLAGHYPRLSLDGKAAMATGLGQLERVLDAAARAGVRRLVYASSAATVAPAPQSERRLSDERDRYAAAPGFGTYHDLKWAMEERALAEDRLDVRVLCPGACLGPHDLRIGTSALLVAVARGACPPMPGGWVNPVDARDVARALSLVGQAPAERALPRRLVLAQDNVRLHDLLAIAAEHFGAPRPPPPVEASRAMALADAEEARAQDGLQRTGRFVRPALAREIVDLVVHGVAVDGERAARALGFAYRRLDETIEAFATWAARMGILPGAPRPTAAAAAGPPRTEEPRP